MRTQLQLRFASSLARLPSLSSYDQIQSDTPALLIEVKDNGVGIPDQPSLGLGLLGMKERVQAFGGTISISKRVGGGTSVAASLPLPKDEGFEQ